jgi:hypothetical protein
MNKPTNFVSTYDEIAAEYYDSVRHPTCANFSELSNSFLEPRIRKYGPIADNVLELGARANGYGKALDRSSATPATPDYQKHTLG